MSTGFIHEDDYKSIHRQMPIPCLDLAIVDNGKVLLVKRREAPAEGQWWLPGGRIRRGENFTDAANRLAKNEVGLEIENLTPLGAESLFFKEDPFGHGAGTHAVALVFQCTAKGTSAVHLDGNHSTYRWVEKAEEQLHPYVARHVPKAILLARTGHRAQ